MQLSDAVRRARKERLHEIQWTSPNPPGGYQDEYEREYRIHSHSHSHSRHDDRRKRHHGDERVVEREREISYEHRGSRGYR